MNDLNQILKTLDWNHKRPFGWGSSPDADWKVIFVTTGVLMFTACILNVLMYFAVDKGGLFFKVETPQAETQKIDVDKLNETVAYYEDKALRFEAIKKGESVVVSDPSL